MNLKTKTPAAFFSPLTTVTRLALVLAAFVCASSAFAASQTWTNAPVSTSWTNVLNWVGLAVPGNINQTANNTGSGDIATFNAPIPLSGIGSAASPIAPDDATNAGRARGVAGITFDTTNCGAYYIASPTPQSGRSNGVLWVSHNSAIRINPTVTNTQTILVPMLVFLPSSTDGIYNLINNSTNPSVSLMISSIQQGNQTTRACRFILDGTNAAPNIVTNIGQGASTGATGGITKQGNNTWVIAGAGTFPAAETVNVNVGNLTIRDAAAFGSITTGVNVNTNGVLQIDGITPNFTSATLKNSGAIRMNGTAAINGIAVSAIVGTTPIVATASASDVFTLGNAANKVTGGLADSVLNVSGPGTVSLPYANNYVGKWSVNAGTLSLSDASGLGTGANVNIAAGATLTITNLGATTWNPTTTGVGGAGTGTTIGSTAAVIEADPTATIDLDTGDKAINLTFTPTAFSGDTTHPALYVSQGTLQLGGNAFTINNAGGTPLGNGTYTLIKQASGSITDNGGYSVTDVSGSGVQSGSVASIQVSGGSVNLVVFTYVPKNLVWTGGAANADWNINSDLNWLNGLTYSVFNNADNVTFNSVGLTNPSVNLTATLAPGSVTVDAAATYTFSGSGSIAGTASLTKKNSGTLVLNTVNTYSGGTVVSNGVIQIGANNAISSTGAGDVNLVSPAVMDLNSLNQAVNGLNGNGTVDTVVGGASVLTVGNNGNGGNFSGLIQNTAGTLAVTKAGTGTQTLSGANTYGGGTAISLGTLKVTHPTALGSGAVSVTGTLDMATNLNVGDLSGTGTIANNSTATTNQLVVTAASPSTFGGSVVNGSGGGAVSLLVKSGTLVFSANGNSFSGGSIVAENAGLQIGNTGSAGSGGILASNNTVVGMRNANNPSSSMGNTVTTVDGATILFTGGGNQANNFFGQFVGSATTTNVYTNAFTIGSSGTWDNFLGTAILAPSASIRVGSGTVLTSGGNATTFDFAGGSIFARDGSTVYLGSVKGGSATSGIGRPSFASTASFIIGGLGQDMVYSGYTTGDPGLAPNTNLAIVKIGAGKLVLDGKSITTNTDSATYTNYLYANIVNHTGPTVVSNGVLALTVPITLSNSPTIRLAGASAVLDARNMGGIVDQLDEFLTVTNQVLTTNGIFHLYSTQTLSGIGTIWGKLNADTGATVSPGLSTGTLTVTNDVTLNGVNLNVSVNRTSTPNCGQLAASGVSTITVSGGTLTLTNLGPDLITGDVFQVFNKAAIGNFAVTNLPASNALNTVQYVWTNKLTIDGTLVLLQGASPIANYSTNITATVNGGNIEISWPATHLGWMIQTQANAITVGLSNNWVTISNTATQLGYTNTIDLTKGSVFYRLSKP